MKEYRLNSFNIYFLNADPEQYALIAPHLVFKPDEGGNISVLNMMGSRHYTKEQGEKFKKIVLDFEKHL